MEIKELNIKASDSEAKLLRRVTQFQDLLHELKKRELSEDVIKQINEEINQLHSIKTQTKKLEKSILRSQRAIIQLVQKKHNLVPQKYHQNLWLAAGMASFGAPIGIAMGFALDNYAFIGVGIPIGMAIGIAIGAGMDKKAKQEGRQLDFKVEL